MHLSTFDLLCVVSYYGEGKKLNGGGIFENTLKITKKNIQCTINAITFFSLFFYFITVFKCLFVCFTPTIYSLQKPQRSQRITGYQRILTTLYFI